MQNQGLRQEGPVIHASKLRTTRASPAWVGSRSDLGTMAKPWGAPLFLKNFPKIKLNSHERSGELFKLSFLTWCKMIIT